MDTPYPMVDVKQTQINSHFLFKFEKQTMAPNHASIAISHRIPIPNNKELNLNHFESYKNWF